MTMPKSATVILHVGLHKTASSSIQRTLGNERDVLRAHGFDYASFTNFAGDDHVNHSLPMFVAFSERYKEYSYLLANKLDPDKERSRFLAELQGSIESVKKSGRSLIISGEEISNIDRADLTKMRDWFARLGVTLQIVCFVRSPYSMTCSDGQEWIKTGRQYRVAHRQSMPALNRLKAVFPTMTVGSFRQASAHAHGPVGFFLELIGMPTVVDITPSKSNESLSDNAARLIVHINEVEPLFSRGTQSPYRRIHDTRPLWTIGSEKYLLLTDEFVSVEESILAENDVFKKELGDDYIDQSFPTRDQPVAWSDDILLETVGAMKKLSPAIAVLAYSYFHAYELAPRPCLMRMRRNLATPKHEQARQNLVPSFMRLVKNRRRAAPDVATRLSRLTDIAFIE